MAEKKKMKSEASSSNSNSSGGQNSSRAESVVMDVGRRRNSCGYCRSASHTSISHGLWALSLTVDDYQALLDRGWRRSGCFVYKPEMERTCCPSYTIRLEASEFVPTKEQLRVSKRVQRFLDGTLDVRKPEKVMNEWSISGGSCSSSQNESANCMAMEFSSGDHEEQKNQGEQIIHCLSNQIDIVVQEYVKSAFSCDLELPKASVKVVAPAKRKLLVEGSEDLLFTSNVSFQISAALRQAKKGVGHVQYSKCSTEENGQYPEISPKLIAEILARHLKEVPESCGLSIRACNGHINFYSTGNQNMYNDIVKSGTMWKQLPAESGRKHSCLNKIFVTSQGKRRQLEIRLRRSSYDPEEYSLYRKYQLRVHNDTPDQVSEFSYRRFLVDTPLIFVPPTGDGTVPPCGFGSFHQQYLIDGQLVAVGVIDILPKCLSSKYLFWDPDLAFLSLGKYSALEEIRWVKENQVHCPSLQYYYLGYYIHSCNKMRYKAAYRPSELLCPLRYQWIPFDVAKPLLDRKRYVVLSDFASLTKGEPLPPTTLQNHMEDLHGDLFSECKDDVFIHEDVEMIELDSEDSDVDSEPETSSSPPAAAEDGDVGNILIGMKSLRLRFKDLCQAFGSSERRYMETQLQRYMRAVGAELSERIVYQPDLPLTRMQEIDE
ncbi:arginyl-tRNA--protein transferase 2 isoform X1 [Coffea eugenioides]|uniref:arginyl-tRNA--protein transferase 2 isoform X1 n=1 Tax=Coffea eugenioides TaxID=49369 RepID=UPI000F607676|nr:arginyl-tRNA--protein transferase 2 isoform X1 [Coffea eugenioides]